MEKIDVLKKRVSESKSKKSLNRTILRIACNLHKHGYIQGMDSAYETLLEMALEEPLSVSDWREISKSVNSKEAFKKRDAASKELLRQMKKFSVKLYKESGANEDVDRKILDVIKVKKPPMSPVGNLERYFIEGDSLVKTVNEKTRNNKARVAAIKIHGCLCYACGFDFEKTYGVIGRGFIEVHHLRPLAAISEEYMVSPRDDLRPVCSNCHSMLHRKNPVLSIEELKRVMKN